MGVIAYLIRPIVLVDGVEYFGIGHLQEGVTSIPFNTSLVLL